MADQLALSVEFVECPIIEIASVLVLLFGRRGEDDVAVGIQDGAAIHDLASFDLDVESSVSQEVEVFVVEKDHQGVTLVVEGSACDEEMMVVGLDDGSRFREETILLIDCFGMGSVGFYSHEQGLWAESVRSLSPRKECDTIFVNESRDQTGSSRRIAVMIVKGPVLCFKIAAD